MKCKKCGQVLDDDMKFCTNCGSPVETTVNKVPKTKKTTKTKKSDQFKLSTTSCISGYKIVDCYSSIYASISMPEDNVINSVAKFGGNISALADIFRGGVGNNSGLVEVYEDAYQAVTIRIIEKAKQNGCNAIIGMRYQSQIVKDWFFLTAYGTACVVEKEII